MAGLDDLNKTRSLLVHHLVDCDSTIGQISSDAAHSLELAVAVEKMFLDEEERIFEKYSVQSA